MPSSIDAARLKRARRRIRGYFLGSGAVLALLYIIVAAFLIRLFGIEVTRYWSTLMMAAGVMLGGTYAIVMFIWIGAHILRRIIKRQPVMEHKE